MKTIDYYKKVIVLNCGGTIDMNKDRTIDSSSVSKTLPNIRELLEIHDIEFESENIFGHSPDSTNIGEDEWDIIYRKIKSIIDCKKAVKEKIITKESFPVEDSVGGIVISHGTDTLQLTSMMLALRLSLEDLFFPIVFTGSFTTIDDDNNDVENNLAKSIFVARPRLSDDLSRRLPPQVYVLIGDEVHLATRTTKVYTTQNTEGKYFFSYPFPVARITSKTPIKKLIQKKERYDIDRWRKTVREENMLLIFDSHYFDELTNSHSSNGWKLAKSFLREKDKWTIVEHIVISKHFAKETLISLTQRVTENNNCQPYGIIIQGNFAQNDDFDVIKNFIQTLSSCDAVILVGSKTVYNKLHDVKNVGLIPKSLSFQKARIKLLYLLKLNLKIPETIRFMSENIAGEIADYKQFPDWIQYENYPDDGETIPVYPNIKDVVYLHSIQKIAKIDKNRRNIYLYGYGNGHIPTIDIPIGKCVGDFLNGDKFKFQTMIEIVESNDIEGNILKEVITIISASPDVIIDYLCENYNFEGYKHQQKNITSLPDYVIEEKENVAKLIIRDSIMNYSNTLKLLGEAIEQGITITVKTSAQAKTDHSLYPVGRTLLAVGINSDIKRGWHFKNLKSKKYNIVDITNAKINDQYSP